MAAPITGTVTPPADLRPAIDALGTKGKRYLDRILEEEELGRDDVRPWMIAQAADYERGEHG